MKKRIFVFLTSLCMMCCMMLMPVQVSAYTADTALTGYPYILDEMLVDVYTLDDNDNYSGNYYTKATLSSQNSYVAEFANGIKNVASIRFGSFEDAFILPLNTEVYDYYITGTLAFNDELGSDISDIKSIQFISYADDGSYLYNHCSELGSVDFLSTNAVGKSFYAKINEINTSNFGYLLMVLEGNSSVVKDNIWFSASIIPVEKGSDQALVMDSILQKLTEINNNLISTNEILTQHDANVKSWFQQLIQSMGIGFSTLYEQMTKEQDEQLHGYEDTTVSEANEAFTSESDKLTGVENELSGASNQYVTEYTAEGFDLGLFTTLANTFAYIATWFTNFWNMGGIFTKALNLCLALSIGFTILRLH